MVTAVLEVHKAMTYLMGKTMSDGHLRYRITNQRSAWGNPFQAGSKNVVRVTGTDGLTVHPKIERKKGSKIRVR